MNRINVILNDIFIVCYLAFNSLCSLLGESVMIPFTCLSARYCIIIFHYLDGLLLSKDTVSNKLAHIAAKIPICNGCVKLAWQSSTLVYSQPCNSVCLFHLQNSLPWGKRHRLIDWWKEDQRLCCFMWRSKIKLGKNFTSYWPIFPHTTALL